MIKTKNQKTVYSMDSEDLSAELIGKSIIFVNTRLNTLTLSDGTSLTFEDHSDCCAWFNATLKNVNLRENVITRVTEKDISEGGGEWDDQHWEINIYSADDLITTVDIEGNPTSGYYGSSVNLVVTTTN